MFNPHNYTEKQIQNALRMKSNSRKIDFRYDLLNRNDIKIGTLDGISKASISYGEFRAIKRSATFTFNEYLQREINYMSDQIQPWFILYMPDGGTVKWSLGLFLLEAPNRNIIGKHKQRDIAAYDKTIIIEEDRFTERYFIAAGTNYIGAVTKILQTAGITNINITDNNSTLLASREFATGTKKKEAINELLTSINYNSIRVDEIGAMRSEPYIEPAKRPITQDYSADESSILYPKFTESLDIAGRANVFTRVAINPESEAELTSTFSNDDVRSPISTVSRGRKIVNFEEIQNISSQEALDGMVRRIAIEASSAYSHLTFSTALMPTHGSADTLYLNIPTVFDAPVKFSETSWDMDLRFDGEMKHEARRVVQL